MVGACTESQPLAPPSPNPSPTLTQPSITPVVQRVEVPAVVGHKLLTAKELFRARGLRIRVHLQVTSNSQAGTILKSTPRAHSLVKPRTRVLVIVAKACVTSNPWCYDFSPGKYIYSPPANFCSFFGCIANFWNGSGYVIQCWDGEFSKSGGISGSCSYHGGNYRPLYAH
jgi:hypothetical protein